MSHDPSDDTQDYSIGVILTRMMKVANDEQIEQALKQQRRMSEEEVLGSILVARGVIDADQLEVALHAQKGLRSKNKHKRAMAMAAISEASGAKIIEISRAIRDNAASVRRSLTGEGHPAITADQLGGAE